MSKNCRNGLVSWALSLSLSIGGLLGWAPQDPVAPAAPQAAATPATPELKPVRRAKRPRLILREWEGTFFSNLFRDGLVGEPPDLSKRVAADRTMPPASNTAKTPDEAQQAPANPSADSSAESLAWKDLITPEVLENEIKRLQIALESQVTTPVKFKTDYQNARYSFVGLSMWMAIIAQHEEQVRWKDVGLAAQQLFARTAANCRVVSDQAFQSARGAQEQLREMVRGGSFTPAGEVATEVDWAQAVDRIPLMKDLEESLERLKQNSGSKGAYQGAKEEVLHDACLIAAIGKVLIQPNVNDADDEEYVALSKKMLAAAREVKQAVELDNYEAAAAAINRIEQSCNDCHADWR